MYGRIKIDYKKMTVLSYLDRPVYNIHILMYAYSLLFHILMLPTNYYNLPFVQLKRSSIFKYTREIIRLKSNKRTENILSNLR